MKYNLEGYFTTNIASSLDNLPFQDNIYYILGNKLINNRVFYNIKEKRQIDNNLYEGYLENDVYNT